MSRDARKGYNPFTSVTVVVDRVLSLDQGLELKRDEVVVWWWCEKEELSVKTPLVFQ